jgi:hypothetical protein
MKPSENTGLFYVDARNALDQMKAPKSPQLGSIKNPLYVGQDALPTGLSRAQRLTVRAPQYLHDITNAYLADSFARQGVDRHAELLTCPKLKGNERPVRYLKKRLTALGIATGKPWEQLVSEIIHCYFKYANVFLIKTRDKKAPLTKRALNPRVGAISGLFLAPVEQMRPVINEYGAVVSWIQQPLMPANILPDSSVAGGYAYSTPQYNHMPRGWTAAKEPVPFDKEDVIHIAYNVQPGAIWGLSILAPVIEDIRLYRQIEEDVAQLIRKNLTPILHHQIPDVTGTGVGRQADIDRAIANYTGMAPDGFYVTPPGHELKVIGAESHAIRAEGYMLHYKARVYAGLGVSPVIMGEDSGAYGNAEAMIGVMVNRVKFCQEHLDTQFQWYLFNELLWEGGFDPWNNEEDRVKIVFNEIDTEGKVKYENHLMDGYNKNCITLTEVRERMDLPPLAVGSAEEKDLFIYRVQIPLEEAKADAKGEYDVQVAKLRPKPTPSKKAPSKRKEAFYSVIEALDPRFPWEEQSLSGIDQLDPTKATQLRAKWKREFDSGHPQWKLRCCAWLDLLLT